MQEKNNKYEPRREIKELTDEHHAIGSLSDGFNLG